MLIYFQKTFPKRKSIIEELFLLCKHDVVIMSNNFTNIWKRIENKSNFNLVSIKKLAFKILKQYYDTYVYNKNIKETNITLNFDVTKNINSEFSSVDYRPSFLNNLIINKSQNKIIDKSYNKSVNKDFKKCSKNLNKNSNKINILENINPKPTKIFQQKKFIS